MTPLTVSFTGLTVDPRELLEPRIEYGRIPAQWQRSRFSTGVPLRQINRWLTDNTGGRWAIYAAYVHGQRIVTVAFENRHDAALFVLADGCNQCG